MVGELISVIFLNNVFWYVNLENYGIQQHISYIDKNNNIRYAIWGSVDSGLKNLIADFFFGILYKDKPANQKRNRVRFFLDRAK